MQRLIPQVSADRPGTVEQDSVGVGEMQRAESAPRFSRTTGRDKELRLTLSSDCAARVSTIRGGQKRRGRHHDSSVLGFVYSRSRGEEAGGSGV